MSSLVTAGKRGAQIEVLKWVAVLTMLVDHIGFLILPDLFMLRLIGRMSFPLFCLVIAYRLVEKPGREGRYLKRLAIWAVISQVPFWVAFNSNGSVLESLNIMVTLGLGVLLSLSLDWFESLYRSGAQKSHYLSPQSLLAGAGLAVSLGLGPFVDYYLLGVLCIPFLVRVLRYDPSHLIGWISFCAFMVNLYANWTLIYTKGRPDFLVLPLAALVVGSVVYTVFQTEYKRVLRLPGWMFYAFYPVHISALIAYIVYVHAG